MTDPRSTLASDAVAAHSTDPGNGTIDGGHHPDGFRRIAGIAGVTAIGVGLITMPLMGSAPGLGASPEEIAAYFTSSVGPHRLNVVIGALLAIPLVLFFAGVHRALASAPGRSGAGWATVFLYGAIMMSATAGLREVLYALAVRSAAREPNPDVLAAVSDGSNIAAATLGAWLAVTVGAVAIAALRSARTPRWYVGLCGVVAVVAVVSVLDTVLTTTGGALAAAAFLGFIIWTLTSAVVMLRRPLLPA
jgi:hypothetical protein